jgi:hypothetical protein
MGTSTRNGIRIDCVSKCVLQHKGVTYPCLLKDISISGVLICGIDFPPSTIQIGDVCGFFLCSDPKVCSIEYASRVTRLGSADIALNFLCSLLQKSPVPNSCTVR